MNTTTKKRQFKGFDPDEAPVSSGREQRPRPEDLVDMLVMPKGKKGMGAYKRFRPLGPVFITGQHWIQTTKRDGSKSSFPVPCMNFSPETGERDSSGPCPWCDAQGKMPKSEKGERPLISFGVDYWVQGIDRAAQEDAPSRAPKPSKEERESGFKDKNSDSYTPFRVHRMTGQELKKVRNLKDLNPVKRGGERVGVSVFDPKFGCDILMKFDKDEAVPSNRWTITKDERTPITEEEMALLQWDLSVLVADDMDADHEKREVESWAKRMKLTKYLKGDVDGDDDDEDGDDEAPKKRRSSAEVTKDLKKKASKVLEDDDDDEEDDDPPPKSKKPAPKKKVVDEDDDDGDDEEDDDPPPKSKKPAVKKKPVVDEDDEDGDDDEDDDPPPKAKKPAPKKKPVIDEDDDDGDDEEDDDPPPPKKAVKKPVSKKPIVDEDDDDDDEDDEPPAKAKKPVAKKKPVVDEDDDDGDDEEDDDPPPKKVKAKVPPPPKGKVAKKKPVDDEDDEDDDIPF